MSTLVPALTRRHVLKIGLGATAGVALAACGADPEQTDGDMVLEFPSWQADDGTFSPWWQELVQSFEKDHPGVRINLYPLGFDSYVDQMTIRFAANDRPDIVHLPARNAAEFAGRGWLEPLNDRLKTTDVDSTWTPLQEEMELDGQSYGVLLLGYGYNLYYNANLLKSVGAGVPRTVDELIDTAARISGNGQFGFGATTAQNPDNYTELSAFVVGTGGSLFDGARVTANVPTTVRGLDSYRRAVAQAPPGIQSQQRNELFLTGKIAMLLDGPFFASELEDAEEEVLPHLAADRPPFDRIPGGVSNSIHLPAGGSSARRDAAWDLIKMATSAQWQRRYVELTANPSPREGALSSAAAEKSPDLQLFTELADEAVSIYPTDRTQRLQFGRVNDIVASAAISLITTDQPTQSIADNLQDQLEEALRP